ncbi:hypothetical protein L208DRAFT_1404706 [Tricholoma matsutake]|nr:hypothetical protein L208DRAFT_1404706 [Tricholoma matsutake 945]
MTTIQNCWRKSGILPDNTNASETLPPPSIPITSLLSSPAPPDPTTCAESNIADSLAELEKRGVLPRANQMDIDELLNPEPECGIIAMNVSDEEIFESVHALAASLILQRYVADLNDPCTCELEAILAGFGHQVCLQELQNMKPTLITSYFTSNCS